MVFKFIALCTLALVASSGAAVTHLQPAIATYSSAPAVSYSHYTSPAIATHTAQLSAIHPLSATTLHHAPATVAVATALPHATVYNTYQDSPAIGSTHQSTVRSFDGTVTHHSKAVDTAFSSVRKSDTRVSNNVYAAAPAAQALTTTTHYATAAAAPTLYAAAAVQPQLVQTHHAAVPVAHAVHYSSAPAVAHVSFDGLGTHYVF